ncbi:cytochrome P450 [Suillus discolor]|uniref:Cytochrome P450 n=1 Tax=Suillus discolor TaxID=1912936 RepID=A0A9P7JYU7_9AGAM|nr:cytochrome P450 [Suillus discolor]KAG2117021.1 cytochrome P450 [Suillus discolor]
MLTITNVTWLDLLCLTTGVYLVKQVVAKKKPVLYPPGPPVWPLIGNILDIPCIKPWLTFTEWGQKYGDIAHVEILGSKIEEVETRRFLKRVLAKHDQLQKHVRRTAGAVILHISYGYKVKENDDPFVDLANHVLTQTSEAAAPGAFMVDILPSLAKVPAWFPGASFKRIAREWRGSLDEMVSAPHDPNFTDRWHRPYVFYFESLGSYDVSALSLYAGGSDTVFPTVWLKTISMTEYNALNRDRFVLTDPQTYANPSQFNPERFLAKDGTEPETEPRTMCFGFVFAQVFTLLMPSIWISTAMSLAVFDISKVVENGVEITPEVEPLPGVASHPKPFKCSIKPRSATALGLIEQDANY